MYQVSLARSIEVRDKKTGEPFVKADLVSCANHQHLLFFCSPTQNLKKALGGSQGSDPFCRIRLQLAHFLLKHKNYNLSFVTSVDVKQC